MEIRTLIKGQERIYNKNMFKLLILSILLGFIGCAEIQLLTPKDVLEHPLGNAPLHIGMNKEEVLNIWGNPHEVNTIKPAEKEIGAREEWVYKSTTKGPVSVGYLTRSQHLIFDGNNLIKFYEEK